MAQLVMRNLEDAVSVRLQTRAPRHGRSTEEEVREILRESTPTKLLGSRLRERFAGIGLEDEGPELRGEAAQPATFEEGSSSTPMSFRL
jgi:plasmid stability protein